MRYDKQHVLDNVSLEDYLEDIGVDLRPMGGAMRGPCPICGGNKFSTRFKVTGELWYCHVCNWGSDVVGLHRHLNEQGFFDAVNELGKKYGLDPSVSAPVVSEKMLTKAVERYNYEVECNDAYCRAVEQAESLWERLLVRSEGGEAYLKKRRCEQLSGIVRYSHQSICLPLRYLDGEIINVVGRRFDNPPAKTPKIKGLKGCPGLGVFCETPSTFDNWESKTTPLIITEGFFDYLSAELLFSEGIDIIGIHGGSNLPPIVSLLREYITERPVILIKHADKVGEKNTKLAQKQLKNCRIVDCSGFKDLNDMMMFDLPQNIDDWVAKVLNG